MRRVLFSLPAGGIPSRLVLSARVLAILRRVSVGRIAFGLLELLLGLGLIVVSHRMSQRAHERGGPMLAAHLLLQVLGVVLALYGLLRVLFAVV